MKLDPDDSRPPYLQVAHQLRAAILTGQYSPGHKLPSGPELAKRFGVARQTVQQAIRELREDGLIVSRQGSGVFVRSRTARPVGLRAHVEHAFKRSAVRIDFAGLSGETLHGAMKEPLVGIRAGRFVTKSLEIRMLLPDMTRPWSLPCRADNLADQPLFRKRASDLAAHHALAIAESVNELHKIGLIESASVQVRRCGEPGRFKLYVLNGEEVFFGFYAVSEHDVTLEDKSHTMFDLMGKDTELFHFSLDDADDESAGTQFVQQSKSWFDTVWDTVAQEGL